MASFPIEILMEILLRLSAQSVVRLRCVCKSWKSLLTSNFFIKEYHERSTELRKYNLLKYNFDKLSKIQMRHPTIHELSYLDSSFVQDCDEFHLVDSYNGIVCLYTFNEDDSHHSKIFLWNPSISRNVVLPEPSFQVADLVGFGFDPSSGHLDNFIVVNINIHFGKHPDRTSQVEVYNFRRKFWKQLGDVFPQRLPKYMGGQVILENFICWCPCFCLNGQRYTTMLVVFDVIKEIFQEIALPDSMPSEKKHIALLDGCLSLITHNSWSGSYEVWIEKEFGVIESWIKLYTVGVTAGSHFPLGFANSGEILFVESYYMGLRIRSPSFVIFYNVSERKFENFGVEVASYYSSRMVTCVESLISL